MQKLYKLFNNKRLRHRFYFLSLVVVLGLSVGACVSTIVSIVQPPTTIAGDTAHIEIDIRWTSINEDHTDRQVIGICMPKGLNARNTTSMHVVSEIGNSKFSPVPVGAVDPASGVEWAEAFRRKFGFGPNLIDDMEWVVFWTDNRFSVRNGDNVGGKVYINIKTSMDNMKFKPGYGMCQDKDGLSDFQTGYYTSSFGDCMEIIEGEGDVIDFCNPQIGIGEPSNATDNDIITIRYNGTLDTTALKNANEVFLCATAVTSTGETIVKCTADETSRMRMWENRKWRIDLWPRSFFNLAEGQTLVRIEYYFMNATGDLKTGYANTADPFLYNFKCK